MERSPSQGIDSHIYALEVRLHSANEVQKMNDEQYTTGYDQFLQSKIPQVQPVGHHVELEDIHKALFPFQKAIVQWAVARGRAAIWAATGLGKTRISLEWARLLDVRTIIFAPLAVARQTIAEGECIDVPVTYVRSQHEADNAPTAIVITNYDMLHAFDTQQFSAVVLDESSILKSYSGATKQRLIQGFSSARYKLACTATPAPNDHMELGNHAEFLGVMDSNEMLSRWFINDSMHAGVYRLKSHAEHDFWRWVTSWAICCSMPTDLGNFDDTPYVLPALRMHIHKLHAAPTMTYERGTLFHIDSVNATDIWKEKHATVEQRCRYVANLINEEPDATWLIWCDTNEESTLLHAMIPMSCEVRGNQSIETKEAGLFAFSSGKVKRLITKPDIAGWGMNWQHCHNVVFSGLTFSYEKLYQAIRRTWRFGQTHPVDVHMIHVDSEHAVQQALDRKHADHLRMQNAMRVATQQYYQTYQGALVQTTPCVMHTGTDYTLYQGDCVKALGLVESDSIGLTITSPPFSNLYIYSDAMEDMGNSKDHEEFFFHMDFLISQLFRVTAPGRLCCIHCKDLPLYMNRDGAAGLYDFPGNIVQHFVKGGWTFHSRITIWKDPVTEMQRTKNHGLLHKNFAARREVCRQGMADYVLVFRAWKDSMEDRQIASMPPPGTFIGENAPTNWRSDRDYSIQVWQRYASPVWFDIRQQRVLDYRHARAEDDEKHICPLQLDVVERCVWLWSTPRDICLDPFSGIGTVGYVALQNDRRYIGTELKEEYVEVSMKMLQEALNNRDQQDLFAAE